MPQIVAPITTILTLATAAKKRSSSSRSKFASGNFGQAEHKIKNNKGKFMKVFIYLN